MTVAFLVLLGLCGGKSAAQTTCLATDRAVTGVNPVNAAALAADCTALLALKDTLRGTASLNWSRRVSMRRWRGIRSVTANGNRVNWIRLVGGGLDGSLPDFGALRNLVRLELGENRLTGTLPDFSALTRLQILDLRENRLTGTIPDLSKLDRLTYLDLSGNGLTGLATPGALNGLSLLQQLYLERNNLAGFPNFRSNKRLVAVFLNGNPIATAIPTWLSGLRRLESLRLMRAQLTGNIPDLSGLNRLRQLGLQGNQLSGPLPASLGDLAALEELHLASNGLTGGIPAELGNLGSLTDLSLCDTTLTSTETLPGALETRRASGALTVWGCVEIADASAIEGSALDFAVEFSTWPVRGTSGASDLIASYKTIDGAARLADYDFKGTSAGSVVIPGNTDTTKWTSAATISVAAARDGFTESDETFTVRLTARGSVVHSRREATGTIMDGPLAPRVSFALASASVSEGAGVHDITVDLAYAASIDLTLNYTATGSATLGTDYTISGVTSTMAALMLAPGTDSATIQVAINDDDTPEGVEALSLILKDGFDYAVGSPASHFLTILDNDAAPDPEPDPEPPPPDPEPPPDADDPVRIDCPEDCWLAPFFDGRGTVVAAGRPGALVEFTMECGNAVMEAGSTTVGPDGLVVHSVEANACGDTPGVLYVSRVGPGGWYWTGDASGVAAAPLLRRLSAHRAELRGDLVDPVDPGGLSVERTDLAVRFEHPVEGTDVILPRLKPATSSPPCDGRALAAGVELSSACTLGGEDMWEVSLREVQASGLPGRFVDPGKLVLPHRGTRRLKIGLFAEDGFLALSRLVAMEGRFAGVSGGPPPRGVVFSPSGEHLLLSAHPRCEATGSEEERRAMDRGVFHLEAVLGFFALFSGFERVPPGVVPPLPPGGLKLTLNVVCPEAPPPAARTVASGSPPEAPGMAEPGASGVVLRSSPRPVREMVWSGVGGEAAPPHLGWRHGTKANSVTIDCGDTRRCYVMPTFPHARGGGFVARSHPYVTVRYLVQCGWSTRSGEAEADAEGFVRHAFPAWVFGCDQAGMVYAGDLEPGAWYWWTAEGNRTAGGLAVPYEAARLAPRASPVDPGGMTRRESGATTWFESGNGMAALLNGLGVGLSCRESFRFGQRSVSSAFPRCELAASADGWWLGLRKAGAMADLRELTEELVDPGRLRLPSWGSERYGAALVPRGGHVMMFDESLLPWVPEELRVRGADGSFQVRGVSVDQTSIALDTLTGTLALTAHPRCAPDHPDRHVVDEGYLEVPGWQQALEGEWYGPLALPPIPRLTASLRVSCPPVDASAGVELAPAPSIRQRR